MRRSLVVLKGHPCFCCVLFLLSQNPDFVILRSCDRPKHLESKAAHVAQPEVQASPLGRTDPAKRAVALVSVALSLAGPGLYLSYLTGPGLLEGLRPKLRTRSRKALNLEAASSDPAALQSPALSSLELWPIAKAYYAKAFLRLSCERCPAEVSPF